MPAAFQPLTGVTASCCHFSAAPSNWWWSTAAPRARPALGDGQLRVALPDPSDTTALETRVVQWYRREALAFFQHRVAVYARQLDVSVSRLGLSSARTRWGSCTSGGSIRLNWRLIKAPPSVIDYVVIHELAHLIELNHSPSFWQIVAQLCPDYTDATRLAQGAGRPLPPVLTYFSH